MMDKKYRQKFIKLFGLEPENMSEFLIISPFFQTNIFQNKLKNSRKFKGIIFKGISGNYEGKKITFINTGIGQSLVVDCLLAQDTKQIKGIVFLGAVGAVRDLNFADMILIDKAFYDTYYYKKFGFHFNQEQHISFSPEKTLINFCLKIAKTKGYNLKQASLISVHTLWDQNNELIRKIYDANIQCLDLECALFYAAAAFKNIRAAALCYVSDLVNFKPYWSDFSLKDHNLIKKNTANLVNLALETFKISGV